MTQDIPEAIKHFKNNKVPGRDGFTAEFFSPILILPLTEVCSHVLQTGQLPPTWSQADIVVIPKKDKDASDVKSYRPISLLNCDYKIFARVLALRLNKILSHYTHPPQPDGFYFEQRH